ncbi:uncharacterized protein V1510DRAFT_200710 [Dipodascopsis tothii]|uniref:uncharacterized protein n=1 Tax=Dipodascopsis tothii TaxID=44089 RepID=UPI0034D005B5
MSQLLAQRGICSIAQLKDYAGDIVNVAGVIFSFKPADKSRSGPDHFISLILSDPTIPYNSPKMINVVYFTKDESNLPPVSFIGDCVIFYKMKIQARQNSYQCVNTAASWFMVLHPDKTVVTPAAINVDRTVDSNSFGDGVVMDWQILRRLQEWNEEQVRSGKHKPIEYQKPRVQSISVSSDFSVSKEVAHGRQISNMRRSITTTENPYKPRHQGFSLIRDVTVNSFYKIIAYVCDIQHDSKKLSVLITDYTENLSLPLMNDSVYKSLNGSIPERRNIMRVFMWDANRIFAERNVKPGMIVEFGNIRIKLDGYEHIEGACHGNRFSPDEVQCRVVGPSDSKVSELLQRGQLHSMHGVEKTEVARSGPGTIADVSRSEYASLYDEHVEANATREKVSNRRGHRSVDSGRYVTNDVAGISREMIDFAHASVAESDRSNVPLSDLVECRYRYITPTRIKTIKTLPLQDVNGSCNLRKYRIIGTVVSCFPRAYNDWLQTGFSSLCCFLVPTVNCCR